MEYYNEEYLMHYGVKGMKWGVRKRTPEEKTAYKSDMNIRRHLESKAHDQGIWAQKYKKTNARVEKQLAKSMARDLTKPVDGTAYISKKTQKLTARHIQLQKDTDAITNLNRDTVNKLEKHIDSMIDKYSDRSIKSMSYKEKDGERYVKTALTRLENMNATYTLIRQGDRYVPQKIRTYIY